MKKKLLALILAGAMTLSLAACGGEKEPAPAENTTPPETETQEPAEAETYKVGICQLVQHDALDAATQGFIDALNEKLPGQVEIDNQNASNDIPMCSTIVNQFISNDVDLIMCNATPALQAAVAATTTIPILGTSVTEYVLAVGLIYCSAEANSQYQVDVVKAELEKLGYTATLYSFSDSNDLAAVTESAAAASEVIYVPTDNTVAANTGIIDNICRPAGIPVVAGEEGIVKGCGVATLSISYYDIGYKTGEMAAQILTGEADIASMPIEYAPQFTKKYNAEICESLNLTVPSDYVAVEVG